MSPGTDPIGDRRMPRRLARRAIRAAADSAGVPWAGRSLRAEPARRRRRHAPPEAARGALRAIPRAATAARSTWSPTFARARLLIPLLAEHGDGGTRSARTGSSVDKTQELSIVTVAAPDGRRVLPVFTSVDAMSRWNPAARPVPADGVRVALAAADDDTDLVVLDPGSDTEFVLRRPAVWAIAQGQPWQPPFDSPDVRAAFERSIGTELAVLDVDLDAGDPDARLARARTRRPARARAPASTRAELDAVLPRLAPRWAADDAIATLVDSLTVRLTSM